MFQRLVTFCALVAFFAVALPGCGGGKGEWEITVENKGDVPCSVFVTMRPDGSSTAHVDDVGSGRTVTLAGARGETFVHTVKVVRGKEEQVLTLDVKLLADQR